MSGRAAMRSKRIRRWWFSWPRMESRKEDDVLF